jgi:hypothetical protein
MPVIETSSWPSWPANQLSTKIGVGLPLAGRPDSSLSRVARFDRRGASTELEHQFPVRHLVTLVGTLDDVR